MRVCLDALCLLCCCLCCRFAKIGSTLPWCWIVSSSGYLLWLSLSARQPLFCRHLHSTTIANPSTSSSPRFLALSGIGISTKTQFKMNKQNCSVSCATFLVVVAVFIVASFYSSLLSLFLLTVILLNCCLFYGLR